MYRILELLKEDFGNRKLSAEYQLTLNKICETEDAYMKYEDYIYLCNHINERFASCKKVRGGDSALKVTMFFCNRADKVLLLSFADNKVAVLYNAGLKVEVRPWCHRARDLRNAEKRTLQKI